jgi:glycosyltransferase involved in cell wall biosynthesis
MTADPTSAKHPAVREPAGAPGSSGAKRKPGKANPRPLFFLAEYNRFNGAQRSCLQLVRHLPDVGLRPLVAFPGEGTAPEAFRRAGAEVHIVKGPPVAHRFGQSLLHVSALEKGSVALREVLPYGLKLLALARRTGANVIHFNTPRSALLGIGSAMDPTIRRILHVRGLLTPLSHLQRAVIASYCSRIIAVAEAVRADVPPLFRRRCVTIYNSIDELAVEGEDVPDEEVRQACQEGRPIVLAVGALVPAKGQHHLLMAAKRLEEGGSRALFVFLGRRENEAYARHLDRMVEAMGLRNTRFVGWSDRPFAWYRAASVATLASVRDEVIQTADGPLRAESGEGLPRTLVEAMYSGVPAVATDIAGVPEMIVPGRTGYLVRQGDPTGLAEALGRALALGDADRRAMSEHARTRARTLFSTERMLERTTAVYRDVL